MNPWGLDKAGNKRLNVNETIQRDIPHFSSANFFDRSLIQYLINYK